MFRLQVLIPLILVWLFTLFAPNIINLLSGTDFTITLNEEEQQEHEEGEKNTDEKLVVPQNHTNLLTLNLQTNKLSFHFYLQGKSNNTHKIILPPPKYFI